MSAGDLLKADAIDAEGSADEGDALAVSIDSEAKTTKPASESVTDDAVDSAAEGAETFDDDAWLDACRDETEDPDDDKKIGAGEPDAAADVEKTAVGSVAERIEALSDNIVTLSTDVEDLRRRLDEIDDDDEAALAELAERVAVMEKTGSEAMGKFGHAMGVIAERIDDLEERAQESAFNAAAEAASPPDHDTGVAPYIANAERELQAAKESGPVDIFDRIAQAAESQYDESRGSTVSRAMSELVDDRRVGTKRWTPSKTMKKRMEKLEAARRAQEEGIASASQTAETSPEVTAETETVAKTAAAPVEAAPAAPVQEKERIVISRRRKQQSAAPSTPPSDDQEPVAEDQTTAADQIDEAVDEDDDAALRVVPGTRGRRRDRARKSRLDEDFEKIFEDDGKPSIGSLRRKLRGGPKSPEDVPEETAAVPAPTTTEPTTTEETFGAAADVPAARTSLFGRLFGSIGKRAKSTEAAPAEEGGETDTSAPDAEVNDDAPASALQPETAEPRDDLNFDDTETADDEAWEQVVQNENRQRQITTPVIGIGLAIAAGGLGFFVWRTFFGG